MKVSGEAQASRLPLGRWVTALVGVGLAVSACSGDTEPSAPAEPSAPVESSSRAEASATSSADPMAPIESAPPGELVAQRPGGSVSCLEKDGRPTSLLQPTLRAAGGPITLIGVRPESSPGVAIVDSEAVLLGPDYKPRASVGVVLEDAWPFSFEAEARPEIVVGSQSALDGFEVPEGRYGAPLLQFTAAPRAATFTAITIGYATSDGTERTVSVPIGTRLSERAC